MITWPLKHNVIRRGSISNTFGLVRRTSTGATRVHQGWDFEAPVGTPCYAIADGTVVDTSNYGDYGQRLLLKFDFDTDGDVDTLYAFYAHLSAVKVKVSDKVKQGQLIALTGESGNAKGMTKEDQHLHFEIRTQSTVGLGLGGRLSPMIVFGKCPLKEAVEV